MGVMLRSQPIHQKKLKQSCVKLSVNFSHITDCLRGTLILMRKIIEQRIKIHLEAKYHLQFLSHSRNNSILLKSQQADHQLEVETIEEVYQSHREVHFLFQEL